MQNTESKTNKICALLPMIRKLSLAYSFVGADADDIAQDAVLKLLCSQSVPAAISPSWLRAVVHNVARDRYRKDKRESRYLDRSVKLSSCGSVCENGYESSVYVSSLGVTGPEPEFFPLLHKLLADMKAPLKQTFLMHAEGYTYAEIALLSSIPIGTVRSRLHHARKQLLANLKACH